MITFFFLLQECYKGKKFGFVQDEDLFTLIIKDPKTEDSGRYTCVIRECNDLTCKAYLEVERKYTLNKYLSYILINYERGQYSDRKPGVGGPIRERGG